MPANKIVIHTDKGEQVLIDLTGDTVTPEMLAEGVIAHDASGNIIIGTAKLMAKYKNLVPTSIDTDGSIYNDPYGYKDNARLSSSGGVSGSAQAGSVVTGFMPWQSKGIVGIKGAIWDTTLTGHYYINIYNTNKNLMYAFSAIEVYGNTGANYNILTSYDEASGVTTIDFSGTPDGTGGVANAIIKGEYFRINAYGKGEDLIVTVNEEIT